VGFSSLGGSGSQERGATPPKRFDGEKRGDRDVIAPGPAFNRKIKIVKRTEGENGEKKKKKNRKHSKKGAEKGKQLLIQQRKNGQIREKTGRESIKNIGDNLGTDRCMLGQRKSRGRGRCGEERTYRRARKGHSKRIWCGGKKKKKKEEKRRPSVRKREAAWEKGQFFHLPAVKKDGGGIRPGKVFN